MKSIEIAHMSDLHYSGGNLIEADRCFGFAVEDAIRRNVQLAIISGDSTDHRLDAHAPALLLLARRLKQLADHCPVFMLQGTFSHEPAGMLHMFAMIGAKYQILVSDRIEMVALKDGKWIEFDPVHPDQPEYDVVITSVPTVNKADLVTTVGASNASEEMGNQISDVLGSFAGINQSLRTRGIPTVLVSHGTVDGSLNESGVPMAGLDHEFTLGSLFSAMCDAAMIGHIHKHQSWSRSYNGAEQVIAYPGSIGRFHYGEIDEKYYLNWNVAPVGTSFEAVVTPSRRMMEIEFDGAPNLKELEAVAETCAGAYVRVRYSIDEEFAKTIDRNAIKEILHRAEEVKIEGTVLTIQRQRCAGISSVKSVSEKLIKWCEITQTPVDGLAERIGMLESSEAEDIANYYSSSSKTVVDDSTAIESVQPLPIAIEPMPSDVFQVSDTEDLFA